MQINHCNAKYYDKKKSTVSYKSHRMRIFWKLGVDGWHRVLEILPKAGDAWQGF